MNEPTHWPPVRWRARIDPAGRLRDHDRRSIRPLAATTTGIESCPGVWSVNTVLDRPLLWLLVSLCAAALLAGCGETERDEQPLELPDNLDELIDPTIVDEFATHGMTIHDGLEPPQIAGVYRVDDHEARVQYYEDNDEMIGRRARGSVWRMVTTDVTAMSLDVDEDENDNRRLRLEQAFALVSGTDDCFTAFTHVSDDGSWEWDIDDENDDDGDDNGNDDIPPEDIPEDERRYTECPYDLTLLVSACDDPGRGLDDFQAGSRIHYPATPDDRCLEQRDADRIIAQDHVELVELVDPGADNTDDDE